MEKQCSKCKLIKEISNNFYKHPTGKDGFKNTCKQCISLKSYNKPYQGTITKFNNSRKKSIEYDNNTKLCIGCNLIQPKSNFIKDGKILSSRCKDCHSFKRIFDKYKLTKEEYIKILKEQNYCCKICENKEIYYKKLIVDHNHNTGEVRGLLCSFCNKGLGLFKDDSEFLIKAIKYLKNNLEELNK